MPPKPSSFNFTENDPEQAAADMARAERDRILASTDWTQLPDAQVNHADWASYRQALRDVPQQETFPLSIDWPVQP